MPSLRIKLPDQTEATYALTGDRITVGRRPDNTIQIIDRSVSAHHAELVLESGGHYRLHDLQSTNLTFVDGKPVSDFHLRSGCTITFGSIESFYDDTPNLLKEEEPKLTPTQMEKDLAFLRAENQELLHKIDALQRRIDILSSARLITKSDASNGSTPEQVKRLQQERDEMHFQNSGLKLELEKLREELITTARERDVARQTNEFLQAEKAALQRELSSQDKGTTQRIILPTPASQPEAVLQRENEEGHVGVA
jgi:pSer/pThr/pTyr-binding forkhead associated (FHA) protein